MSNIYIGSNFFSEIRRDESDIFISGNILNVNLKDIQINEYQFLVFDLLSIAEESFNKKLFDYDNVANRIIEQIDSVEIRTIIVSYRIPYQIENSQGIVYCDNYNLISKVNNIISSIECKLNEKGSSYIFPHVNSFLFDKEYSIGQISASKEYINYLESSLEKVYRDEDIKPNRTDYYTNLKKKIYHYSVSHILNKYSINLKNKTKIITISESKLNICINELVALPNMQLLSCEDLKDYLSKIHDGMEDCVFILPYVEEYNNCLDLLIDMDLKPGINLFTQDSRIYLKDFQGEFSDCYGNYVICENQAKIQVVGCLNRIEVKATKYKGNLYIFANACSECIIEENVKPLNLRIHLLRNGLLHIDKNVTFAENCKIKVVEYRGRVYIGDDCMFSTNVILFCGDGHQYTKRDLKSGGCRVVRQRDRVISISRHVWIGYQALILNNTILESDIVVGARSVVKGKFERNVIIAGLPARIIRKNIKWEREPFSFI